jgi:VanZ family protein
VNFISRLDDLLSKTPRSRRLGIAWSYCLLLVYLLISPSPLAPFGDWGLNTEAAFDRTLSSFLEHVIAYMGLVCVFWWGYRPRATRAIAFVIGGAVLHGMLFEGLQYFVPSRYCDWQDLFCNFAGVGLGVGFIQAVKHGWLKPLLQGSEEPPTLPNSIPLKSGE